MSVKDFVAETAGFFAIQNSLEMLQDSARAGYHVPFVKKWAWGRLSPGPMGVRKAKYGIQSKAMSMFEAEGLTGFRAVEKEVASKFGRKISAGIGGRYLLGRVAGIGMTMFNLSWQIPMVAMGTSMAWGALTRHVDKNTYAGMGDIFPETRGAYTSRQRALQAITASSLQARSAIGNEAMLMHR